MGLLVWQCWGWWWEFLFNYYSKPYFIRIFQIIYLSVSQLFYFFSKLWKLFCFFPCFQHVYVTLICFKIISFNLIFFFFGWYPSSFYVPCKKLKDLCWTLGNIIFISLNNDFLLQWKTCLQKWNKMVVVTMANAL